MNSTHFHNPSRCPPSIFEGRPAPGSDLSPVAFRRGLLLLALLGLILRGGFLLEHTASPSFGVPTLDQKYYDTTARALLAGQAPPAFRPVLYPLVLAGCRAVAGDAGIPLAVILQHLAGVATGLLIAVLGARLFRNRPAGLYGGLLYLLAPLPLAFEGELLCEPLYTLLGCLCLWAGLRAVDSAGGKSSAGWWLLCGGILALAAQVRANILVFLAAFPLLAVGLVWRLRSRSAGLPLLALVGWLLVTAAWGSALARYSGHFQLLPTAGGINFYLGNHRGADGMTPMQGRRVVTAGAYEDSIEVWAREEYAAAMRVQGCVPESDPQAVSRFWTRRTCSEIAAAPGAWARLLATKCWLMLWNAEPPNNKSFAFLQEEFAWLRRLPVRWVVLLMLAAPGIWAAFRWGCRPAAFLLLLFAGSSAAAMVLFFVCDRFRYPLWPALSVLAGGGVAALLSLVRRRALRPLAILAGLMALLAAVSLPNWCGARLPSFARDWFFRSIAGYEKGRLTEALADIDRSLALDALDPPALQQRGNVLLALGRCDEAATAFMQSLTRAPADAAIWCNLGAALRALGRTDEARNSYLRAIVCQPPSPNAFLGLALLELRAGRLDAADVVLRAYESRYPEPHPIALAGRAILGRQRGQAAQAQVFERESRRLDAAAYDWACRQAGEEAARQPTGR